MNKKILVVTITLLFVAILVTPVMAIGPTNAKNNKNLVLQDGNQVWMKHGDRVFQEWNVDALGLKIRLMRLDASKVNIGNAEDASDWVIVPMTPSATFVKLLMAETRWVYFDYEAMYNLLRGFGMPPGFANMVRAPFDPLGCYYKADIVGKIPT
ncbi:hypothetical protein ACFLRN_08865 [Thermoproteota archaeon]